MASPSFQRLLLLSCSGPIIWALHFVLIYGFTGVVCARPNADWTWAGLPATSLVIVASGVLALGLIALFALRARPRRGAAPLPRFVGWTTLGMAGLSAVAVVYETLVVWLVPGCV
ncbi:hypothetical protein [Ramlibacter rhizophilus]|uniref:Uncharacterized protein n=1 Tax=Ramlibacter rhizophilus TaxID=1781167 RepID=A0A4Z0BQ10_9BURK|nr:hypothetical protein [Ramlibacter rhizophilus]TFZ01383.1 hypothetical protein EZ242_08365 [Ramlibacter rhizophilus]